jgi:protein TonB
MMSTMRFWVAVLLSGSLHVGGLTACLLDHWPWGEQDTPPELLQPYGNSDHEGFDVEAISLTPGTWRQGDQHTPGGDDASEQPVVPASLAEQPQNIEPEPTPPSPLPLPVVRLDSPSAPSTARKAETTTSSSRDAGTQTTSAKTGLPGAPGGADMPLGTPSKGGIVGRANGVKFLHAGRKTYPAEAARLGQEGTPLVWMRISEAGDVLEARLHRSCGYPLLDAAAVKYALTMKYRPARHGGTPVESTATQPIEYVLP